MPSRASVVFRDSDGTVLFRTVTNQDGRVNVPIDYRAFKFDQQFESFLFRRQSESAVGGIAGGNPGTKQYDIVVCAEPFVDPTLMGDVPGDP